MKITFTLGVDGGIEDISSLMRWIDATYNQAIITIDVPEFIPATPVAASEATGVVSEIEDYESYQRAQRRYERRQHERLNHDVYVSVPCSLCGALAGDDCMTAHGRPSQRVHKIRRREADQLDVATPVDWASDDISTDSDRAAWANYCRCSHTEAVHFMLGDRGCTIALCSCSTFTAVEPFPAVTLDEM